jgi:integrase
MAAFTTTYIRSRIGKVERERLTDEDCGGLTVSITSTSAAFGLRFTDPVTGKQRGPFKIGVFHPETFNVSHARAKALRMKADVGNGIDIVAQATTVLDQKRAEGKTFNEVADLYIDHLRTPTKKAHGVVPLRESWAKLAGREIEGATSSPRYEGGYLKRARETFGKVAVSTITDDHVALLLEGIIKQGYTGLAVNLRSTLFGLFKWAGQPGRKYVRANPCSNLGKRPVQVERDRAFDAEEIRTFWFKLDDENLPAPRPVALAMRMMLCSGLRGGEICAIQREWLRDLGTPNAHVRLPAWLTKPRKPIHHPLNSLAQEAIMELLAMSDAITGPLFPPGPRGATFTRHMLTDYMTDRGYNSFKPVDGKVRRRGVREFMMLEFWRPHDIRHTVTTLLVSQGLDFALATQLLGHAPGRGKGESTTTARYANLNAEQTAKLKRPTLEMLDGLLRGIIGLPVPPQSVNVAALQKQIADLQAQIAAATSGVVVSINRAA